MNVSGTALVQNNSTLSIGGNSTFDANFFSIGDQRGAINETIALGKKVWEDNNSIGCHTLLGEGAYFAPELGNVYKRFGNSTEAIKGFIAGRPKEGIPGRRSMPQFNLSAEELEAVAQFLKYSSEIDTENWPPNIQG